MELNTELLRWGLLLLTFPIWGRFLATLWGDFSETMIEEGGLFGQPPNADRLARMRAEIAARPDLLLSEPWAQSGGPAARSRRTQGPGRSSPAFQPRPRKRGFR